MIWKYRAVKNPVARIKWITLCLILLLLGFSYTAYKIAMGASYGKSLIATTIFTLFVVLYTIITLGRERYYYIEGNTIYYKPFKTDLSKVKDYEVQEDKLIIKLNVKNPFSVRTLYFENVEDLREVEKLLKKIIKKQ